MHTVWAVSPDFTARKKAFFTGTYEECLVAVRHLLDKGWPVDRLGIICHETDRWVSWVA